ncbi:hypothetical protein PO124_10565 [Bacillus licheniformis]|nr:hypothetical protein [Bacillus licheniformis]
MPVLVKSKHELPETAASIEEGTIPERFSRISFEWKGIRQDLAETKAGCPSSFTHIKSSARNATKSASDSAMKKGA